MSISRSVFITSRSVLIIFFSAIASLGSQYAQAWGGRGHASICEAAVFLVKEEGLKSYLQNKPHMMGHLCNIPDTYWRSLGGDANKLGSPTHYINAEITGLKIKDVPADYRSIVTSFTGKPNQYKESATIFSIPEELGSVWWRADQFYRRAIESGKLANSAEAPKNSKDEQDESLPYNKAAFEMIVNMGLMGHYVGDVSQPLHNTSDYDGYASNHGGIHAYYEDASVSHFDGDLTGLVLKKARGLKKTPFLQGSSVVEKMKGISTLSVEEVRTIWKLDPVIRPSSIKIEKGVSFKIAAERPDGKVGWNKFNKLILEQMARSALLLANSWDSAFEKAGRPKLTSFKSYKYPFTPDFVPPDYFDVTADEAKSKHH